jgi:putative addiction module component (TIGR02574 family)
MNAELQELPVEERIRIVEELWDGIVAEQRSLGVTPGQKEELDRRMDA